MFPRLHVNDTEQGGLKGPPRNKMALYEQLSIPSQGFSSRSTSLFPFPTDNNNIPVASTSSSNIGCRHSMFTQFCNSDAPSHLSEKLHVNPSRGVKSNVAMPPNFSNVRSFSLKKDVVVDDDYEVHGRNSYGRDSQCSKDDEKLCHINLRSSLKLQHCSGKMMSATKSIELKSRQFGKNQEDNLKVSQSGHFPEEGSANPLANYRKMGSCSSTSLMVVNSSEPLKQAHLSSIQEVKCVSVNSLNRLGSGKLQLHQAHVALGNKMTLRDDNLGELTADGIHRCTDSPKNGRDCFKDKTYECQVADIETSDHSSNNPIMNLALDISPVDVVEVIGKKHFCEARSAIINQQRIFVVQVFELHRLIKVQRSIAASPHLLLDDNLLPGKPSLKVSELNKLPCGYAAEPPCLVVKPKDKSEKPTNAECPENNVVGKLPLPFLNKEMSQRGLVIQQSDCRPHPGNHPLAPLATNTKQSPLYFHPPPGSQWLVQIMSPTEGLVYKPYTGLCAPMPGFMAPVYGGCGPMSLNPGGRDFLTAAYGFPAHQGIGILPATPLGRHFPPCGLPVLHPSVSASAFEGISPFTEACSNGHDNRLSIRDINSTIPQQSSCNNSIQVSQAASAKENELPGSTVSSSSDKKREDILPLFPVEPAVDAPDQKALAVEHQTRVIKVLPHNPRSATKSAARIFKSIQEERRECNWLV